MAEPQRRADELTGEPLLLMPLEAAQVLRVGRTTVYALIKAGELRPVHIGRSCRISRAELERYVQHLQALSPPQPTRTRSRRRGTTTDQGKLFDVVHSPPDRP